METVSSPKALTRLEIAAIAREKRKVFLKALALETRAASMEIRKQRDIERAAGKMEVRPKLEQREQARAQQAQRAHQVVDSAFEATQQRIAAAKQQARVQRAKRAEVDKPQRIQDLARKKKVAAGLEKQAKEKRTAEAKQQRLNTKAYTAMLRTRAAAIMQRHEKPAAKPTMLIPDKIMRTPDGTPIPKTWAEREALAIAMQKADGVWTEPAGKGKP